jgi:MarR family transcriptional regulator for hemolysin
MRKIVAATAVSRLRHILPLIISLHMMSTALAMASAAPERPTFSQEREIGFALNDVARMLRTYADQRARDLNMTRAQWAVLVKLQRCEGVKQSELAESLDLAPITLARLIDKLTASGLVDRRDDPHDRRANRLYLTDKAGPTLERLGALGEDLMGRALAGLPPETLACLRQGLERIRLNLKHELHPGV